MLAVVFSPQNDASSRPDSSSKGVLITTRSYSSVSIAFLVSADFSTTNTSLNPSSDNNDLSAFALFDCFETTIAFFTHITHYILYYICFKEIAYKNYNKIFPLLIQSVEVHNIPQNPLQNQHPATTKRLFNTILFIMQFVLQDHPVILYSIFAYYILNTISRKIPYV